MNSRSYRVLTASLIYLVAIAGALTVATLRSRAKAKPAEETPAEAYPELAKARAATRQAEASGRPARPRSMLTISAARLEFRAAAIASSTAQNSGSSAIEVAWPESRTERFFRVAIRALFRVHAA